MGTIRLTFVTQRPLRDIILDGIRSLKPSYCPVHLEEEDPVDVDGTLEAFASEHCLCVEIWRPKCPSRPGAEYDSAQVAAWNLSHPRCNQECAVELGHSRGRHSRDLTGPRPDVSEVIPLDLTTAAQGPAISVVDRFKHLTCPHALESGGPNHSSKDLRWRVCLQNKRNDYSMYASCKNERVTSESQFWVIVRRSGCLKCNAVRIGVPPLFQGACFDRFIVRCDSLKAGVEACKQYAAKPKGFLVLRGGVGCGKTTLAVSIARGVSPYRAFFISHSELLRQHRQSYGKRDARSDEDEVDVLSRAREVHLLILDDFGRRGSGRDEEAILHSLLNTRYENMLPTVLTTNLSRQGLEDSLGPALFDRLREACNCEVEILAPSMRAARNGNYLSECR